VGLGGFLEGVFFVAVLARRGEWDLVFTDFLFFGKFVRDFCGGR
jgi:hypothetical protein